MNKKGQSMSVNVIIVAVLALIVLVVLAAIFMGRITIFEQGVNKAGQAKTAELRISYGQCRPNDARENAFGVEYSKADSPEAQEQAVILYQDEITNCKYLSDRTACESSNCRWS